MSTLISAIIVLCIIGILLWAVNRFLPIGPVIKNIIYFIVVLGVCLWLLSLFGVISGLKIH